MAGRTVAVLSDPELMLLVDLIRPAEGEFRFKNCHDVICQLSLRHDDTSWKNNVYVLSSRAIPTSAASVVQGSKMPTWLDLEEVDDVVCAALPPSEVRAKFGDSIGAFSSHWVTEYSLKSIGSISDAAVAEALRARDMAQYNKLIKYLDQLPGANAETIRNYLRNSLVAPEEIAELLARAPTPDKLSPETRGDFERTMEIRAQRAQRDKE
jgi:hypothetical protein